MGEQEEPDGGAVPSGVAVCLGDATGGRGAWSLPVSGTPGASHDAPPLTAEAEIAAFRAMLLIRRFEEKAGQLYAFGDIGGYCHLSVAQEAVAVGLALAAAAGDQMVTGHRCHGHLLARGGDPRKAMAELAGKRTGLCGGKGGSMHLFDPAAGFYGGQGIVGAAAPIAAGLAFNNRYRGDDRVAWCCIGDRAADQGQVSEALDMASRWRLPLVMIIENNSGENERVHGSELWRRGEAYGVGGERVDGAAVGEVRAAAWRAAAHARSGKGPRVIEATTACFRGHALPEDAALSPAELQARREHEDPIERARKALMTRGVLTRDAIRDLDDAIRDLVADAADAAQADAEPEAGALLTDVVAHG